MLLLVVYADKHPNKFARNLTVMLIQALQIGDQLDVCRLEAVAVRTVRFTVMVSCFGAAKAQPFGRNAEPLRNHAQLLLGGNRLSYQPFPGGVDGNRPPLETDVKLPCQPGRAIRGVVGVFQSLLKSLAKTFAFIRRIHSCTISCHDMNVSLYSDLTNCDKPELL